MKKIIDKWKSFPSNNSWAANTIIAIVFQLIALGLSFLFFHFVPDNTANITLIYALALVFIARYTTGYFYGIFSAVFSVICINYMFIEPYFTVNFTLTGYPVTFIGMLILSLSTSTMTNNIKTQAAMLQEREKMLMDAEKERMRANLLRAVSHDLRTPLTGIIGNSNTYLESHHNLPEEKKAELVSFINDDANWLLNMVENLLSVTRIQTNSMRVNTEPEAVEEVVAEAVSRFRKRLGDVPLCISIPEDYAVLPIDAVLIEQVIINLLENAVMHSGSTHPIEFSVTDAGDSIRFSVKDFGHGIAPEKLETIFDGTDYNTGNSSDAHKGMGIGLSICKTIITAHHGTITANNHENGAEFTFILPKEE